MPRCGVGGSRPGPRRLPAAGGGSGVHAVRRRPDRDRHAGLRAHRGGRPAGAVPRRPGIAGARAARAEQAGRRSGGGAAGGAEHHRPAAVEGRRDARRLGAAPGRPCPDRRVRRPPGAAAGCCEGDAAGHPGASAPGGGTRDGSGIAAGPRAAGTGRGGAGSADAAAADRGAGRRPDRAARYRRDSTIGGGVVLDPFPPRRGRRTPRAAGAARARWRRPAPRTRCGSCWRRHPAGPTRRCSCAPGTFPNRPGPA